MSDDGNNSITCNCTHTTSFAILLVSRNNKEFYKWWNPSATKPTQDFLQVNGRVTIWGINHGVVPGDGPAWYWGQLTSWFKFTSHASCYNFIGYSIHFTNLQPPLLYMLSNTSVYNNSIPNISICVMIIICTASPFYHKHWLRFCCYCTTADCSCQF